MFDTYTSLLSADIDYTSSKVKMQYKVDMSEYDMRSPESMGRAALHVLDLNIQMQCTRIDLVKTDCNERLPKGHWLCQLQGTSFVLKDGVIVKYLRPKCR
jgi:hypothetical protein